MLKVISGLKGALKINKQLRTIFDSAATHDFNKPSLPPLLFTTTPLNKELPPQHINHPIIDPTPLKHKIEKFDPLPCNPIILPTPQVNPIEDGVKDKPTLHLMPLLVTIRRKKMKKHKRRKLKRKLLFVKRKFRHAQAKIKEKKIVDYEMKQRKWGEDYDAVANLKITLDAARKAGWGIDVIAEYKASKRREGSQDGRDGGSGGDKFQ